MNDIIDNLIPEDENSNSPYMVIAVTLIAILLFTVVGGVIMLALLAAKGMSMDDIAGFLTSNSSVEDRNLMRQTLLVNQLFTFAIPGIVTALFLFKSKWLEGLSLNLGPKLYNIVMGSLLILASTPLIQYSFILNKNLPLPEWMLNMEEGTNELLMNLLVTDTPLELFFNVFLVAIVPAIGEEIIFRGLLQKQVQRMVNNPHIAVWIAAIIFSAIHMQFQGFIPRMLLGAFLGYLLYWTGNLWIPIIAHFFNNAVQVVAQYLFSEDMSDFDLEAIDTVPLPAAILSVALVVGLGYLIWQKNKVDVV